MSKGTLRILCQALITLLIVPVALAKPPVGGGEYPLALPSDHITAEQRAAINEQIRVSRERLIQQGKLSNERAGAVLFDWPMDAAVRLTDAGYHGISNFVDQNATFPGALLDYNCGARTYDLSSGYNHRGIDFFTFPFAWNKMDNDEVYVVAAADGTIIFKADGNFDRSCSISGGNWNAVYVEHADGSIAWYGHMKSGSVIAKNIGDTVTSGEVLGVVGSSGSSSGPHLHLEIYDADANLIEPYQGTCNSLNANSWWANQREYYDSALNGITTNIAPPDFGTCPAPAITNARQTFTFNELIYLIPYYRDQLNTQVSNYLLRRPDGSVVTTWQHSSDASHYVASYWWWNWTVVNGEQSGTWKFEVTYEGTTTVHPFNIVALADTDADGLSDHLDNCINTANASQLDGDDDGYGNACDPDLNNDKITNFLDVGLFANVFQTNDVAADFNGDGSVNFLDYPVLVNRIFTQPGPSAFVQ